MYVQINSNEMSDIYLNKYQKSCSVISSNSSENEILNYMNIDNYNYKNFSLSDCSFMFNQDVVIKGNFQDNYICMSFMIKGETKFTANGLTDTLLFQNTCNIFSIVNGGKHEVFINKNTNCEHIDIHLELGYFLGFLEKYPQIFNDIIKKINISVPFLFNKASIFLSPEMTNIVKQIQQASIMGSMADMYIDAKIQELIFLLLVPQTRKLVMMSTDLDNCKREKLFEVKYIIDSNYLKPYSISALSKIVGLNETAMKKGFKELFNNTIYGYLFDIRMEKAQKLLLSNNISIADVADKVGYEHQSHFTTAFKRKFKYTPREFKQLNNL